MKISAAMQRLLYGDHAYSMAFRVVASHQYTSPTTNSKRSSACMTHTAMFCLARTTPEPICPTDPLIEHTSSVPLPLNAGPHLKGLISLLLDQRKHTSSAIHPQALGNAAARS